MRKKTVLIALLLCLSLLLQSCVTSLYGNRLPDSTLPDSPTSPAASEEPGYTPYDEYERYEPAPFDPIPFSELVYERLDAQALCDGFARVQALVEAGEPFETVQTAFEEVYDGYLYYDTLLSYAYIRYTLDLNDAFYDEEYNWCEEQAPRIDQAAERCYIAMANSPLRGRLEEEIFGEGFFAFYDENQIYSDRVVALMQQESELQTQYMALQSDRAIEWDGREQLVDDLLSDPELSYPEMVEVYERYYEKYAPQDAELYIRLIRVHREIAEALGYDSYADFAYAYTYERDYTPAQVARYTESIAEELGPLYYYALSDAGGEEMEMDDVMELLGESVYRFGGEIATAYEFMRAYDLYDVTKSSSKMPGSYMTYLSSYGMPFLYVSPTGTIDDFLTVSHEFGHFVEGYVNCNRTTSIDCAEIFSQGLEYLMLSRAELSRRQREELTESKLADSLAVFLTQACYAEFEARAHELPDEELTLEGLNRLHWECLEEFGMAMPGLEELLAPSWIDVQHFFIAPFYVISYCISNDAALQVFEAEQNDGTGLDVYYDLMEHTAENTVLALLEEVGLQSPFDPDRMHALAEFFELHLS